MALANEDLMAIPNLTDQKIHPLNDKPDRIGHKHGKQQFAAIFSGFSVVYLLYYHLIHMKPNGE